MQVLVLFGTMEPHLAIRVEIEFDFEVCVCMCRSTYAVPGEKRFVHTVSAHIILYKFVHILIDSL